VPFGNYLAGSLRNPSAAASQQKTPRKVGGSKA